jgi:hypothetical protein
MSGRSISDASRHDQPGAARGRARDRRARVPGLLRAIVAVGIRALARGAAAARDPVADAAPGALLDVRDDARALALMAGHWIRRSAAAAGPTALKRLAKRTRHQAFSGVRPTGAADTRAVAAPPARGCARAVSVGRLSRFRGDRAWLAARQYGRGSSERRLAAAQSRCSSSQVELESRVGAATEHVSSAGRCTGVGPGPVHGRLMRAHVDDLDHDAATQWVGPGDAVEASWVRPQLQSSASVGRRPMSRSSCRGISAFGCSRTRSSSTAGMTLVAT